MTSNVKLLPLPELPVAVERFILSSLGPVKREGAVTALRTMLREYARANVAHATAAQDAEIARLTEALEFQSALKKNLLPYQDEAVASRAEIEALRAEVERLQEIVRPKREDECLTLDHWRMRAYHLEASWSRCSRACAGEQTKREQAEARAERLAEALRNLLALPEAARRTKRYVQGVGWCWMEDGEAIEVISDAP